MIFGPHQSPSKKKHVKICQRILRVGLILLIKSTIEVGVLSGRGSRSKSRTLRSRTAMFHAFPSLPADTVTTRKLQLARRSAERKGKPRPASNKESRVTGQLSVTRSISDKADICNHSRSPGTAQCQLTQIKSSPPKAEQVFLLLQEFALSQGWTLPALCRTWSFGLSCEQLLSLFRQLPHSMLKCFGHINSTWDRILKCHSATSLKQKFGSCLNADESLATDLDRNPALCKLTMTFDASTQMRRGFITNHSMGCAEPQPGIL